MIELFMILGMLRQPIAYNEPKPIENTYEFWSARVDNATDDYYEREWMKRVMWCESKGNQYAKNQYSTASGLYQYLDSTWAYECTGNVWNGFDNMRCALKMYRQGKSGQWSCK